MDDDRESRIRQRAYAIWKQEGCPEGRQEEHWRKACEEIEREDGQGQTPASDGQDEPAPVQAA